MKHVASSGTVRRATRWTALLAAALALGGCIDLTGVLPVGGVSSMDGAGRPVPGAGLFDAQVVNESLAHADVTLRFLLADMLVHETVLYRVAPATTTFIAGPELATYLVAGGVDDTGRTLPEERFTHDGNSGGRTLAVYVITDPPAPPTPEPTPTPTPTPPPPPTPTPTPTPPPPPPPDDVDTGGVIDVDTTGPSGGTGGGGGNSEPAPPDCNTNGIDDALDLAAETSADVNENGVPDECDPDCNGNALPDDQDLAAGTSVDHNSNGVPDECERVHVFFDDFNRPDSSTLGFGWVEFDGLGDPPSEAALRDGHASLATGFDREDPDASHVRITQESIDTTNLIDVTAGLALAVKAGTSGAFNFDRFYLEWRECGAEEFASLLFDPAHPDIFLNGIPDGLLLSDELMNPAVFDALAVDLPPAAWGTCIDLRVRVRVRASQPGEGANIDDVRITGTPLTSEPATR